MKVLCFGSMNLDYVYKVDHMVRPGETESSDSVSLNCGGKGLNQSVALAKAGVSVWHAGMVGSDGEALIEKCREYGVSTDFVRMTDGRSGHTIIQVDKTGDNSIILYGGANKCMTEDFINEVIDSFEKGDIILLQNEINLLDVIIDKAYEMGLQIVLNPSPYDDALVKCDFSKVSYFLLNEIEGEQMTGETEPEKMLSEMHRLYPSAKIVLTLGEEGSIYMDDKEELLHQEAFKVQAVDTTAAGDTFTGYFIASIIQGMSPKQGLELSSKASSITVTRPGAMDSIPTMPEVI